MHTFQNQKDQIPISGLTREFVAEKWKKLIKILGATWRRERMGEEIAEGELVEDEDEGEGEENVEMVFGMNNSSSSKAEKDDDYDNFVHFMGQGEPIDEDEPEHVNYEEVSPLEVEIG
jgi:hypothetical protein